MIRCVYDREPTFPATDQHPDAVRYQLGGRWVDAVGGQPTLAELQAILTPTQDTRAVLAIDSVDRLQFEVLFNHETRVRALEALAPITRSQFRDALIARWKTLNP